MHRGYIKLYRKIIDNPIINKDADHLATWIYLLLNATHKKVSKLFNGKSIDLIPGQLITGRKTISQSLKCNENKIQRILSFFKSEQLIEQRTSTMNRLITILSWESYNESEQPNEQRVNNGFLKLDTQKTPFSKKIRKSEQPNEQRVNNENDDCGKDSEGVTLESEQPNEQRVNNERTTSEQRVNTNKNDKNVNHAKNEKNKKDKTDKNSVIGVKAWIDASRAAGRVTPIVTGPLKGIAGRIAEKFDDQDELMTTMKLYFQDEDKFLVSNGHPIHLFESRIEKYRNEYDKLPTLEELIEEDRKKGYPTNEEEYKEFCSKRYYSQYSTYNFVPDYAKGWFKPEPEVLNAEKENQPQKTIEADNFLSSILKDLDEKAKG